MLPHTHTRTHTRTHTPTHTHERRHAHHKSTTPTCFTLSSNQTREEVKLGRNADPHTHTHTLEHTGTHTIKTPDELPRSYANASREAREITHATLYYTHSPLCAQRGTQIFGGFSQLRQPLLPLQPIKPTFIQIKQCLSSCQTPLMGFRLRSVDKGKLRNFK